MKTKNFAYIAVICFLLAGCSRDNTSPAVVSSFPENGSQNVDPDTKAIWVKFSEPMLDKSWSWSYLDKSKFPEIAGGPVYSEDNTKNTLPVHLKPNQEYSIWINTDKFQSFKDKAGNSSVPFELKFKTK